MQAAGAGGRCHGRRLDHVVAIALLINDAGIAIAVLHPCHAHDQPVGAPESSGRVGGDYTAIGHVEVVAPSRAARCAGIAVRDGSGNRQGAVLQAQVGVHAFT